MWQVDLKKVDLTQMEAGEECTSDAKRDERTPYEQNLRRGVTCRQIRLRVQSRLAPASVVGRERDHAAVQRIRQLRSFGR